MIKSSKSSVPEVFNMNKKNYGLLGIEMDLRSLTNIFHICKKYTLQLFRGFFVLSWK